MFTFLINLFVSLVIFAQATPDLPICVYENGKSVYTLCYTPIAEPGFEYQGEIFTGSIKGYMPKEDTAE